MSVDPDALSTAGLDYLQRSGFRPPPLPSNRTDTTVPLEATRLMRVAGVGVLDKNLVPGAGEAALGRTVGMLSGLYGYKLPIAFLVHGGSGGVAVELGTWGVYQDGAGDAAALHRQVGVLTSLLRAAYPLVSIDPAARRALVLPVAGLALGVPTVHPPDPRDGSLAIDRLIQAMTGGEWAVHVLAEPISDSYGGEVRASIINEMRAVQSASLALGAPSPLAEHYTQLLRTALDAATQGQSVGAWRVAVYLTGEDEAAYHRLAAA